MAKGFAHLGLLFLLLAANGPAVASTVADLYISEVMANPAAVTDGRGEWFELFNPTATEVNLRDTRLHDDGSDAHRIEVDLLILPGHFLTLARNGATQLNGGIAADYVYDHFKLGNGSDEIVFSRGLLELLRLDYGPGFVAPGRSRELVELPMTAAHYALSPAALIYGDGDIGSPGTAGLAALSAVPLPAASWLFLSGLLTLASTRLTRRA